MEELYDKLLAEDFLLLLDMCPPEPFPPDSAEANLAKKWLNYLCTYEVEDLNDRRLKNVYVSHLAAALIQRKLYGPFCKEPLKGKLEKIDFFEETAHANTGGAINHQEADLVTKQCLPGDVGSRPTICGDEPFPYTVLNDTSGPMSVASTNLTFNAASNATSIQYPCTPRPCQCTLSGPRSKAGADTADSMEDEEAICNHLMQKLNLTPGFLNEFDATLTSFMDLIGVDSPSGRTQDQIQESPISRFPHHDYLLPQSPIGQDINNNRKREATSSTHTSKQELAQYINYLLQAISAELRGDAGPGSSVLLDYELMLYKRLFMEQSDLADNSSSLTSNMKLRNCLLLCLQNDLIKLLTEEKSQINIQT